MGALLELVPIKDWFYTGIIVLLLIFGVHEYQSIEARGAAHEQAAVQAASVKATAAAKALNDKTTADYSAAVVTVGENYAKSMQDADASHAADLERLQQRAAGGNGTNAAVGSAAGTAAASDAGSGSTVALGSVPAQLTLDFADAIRADDAALTACYADRDSLTGK